MTIRTLISRSLRHYWRTHIGVVLGVAVAATVLVGALAVGDSVRESLRRMALDRLGETHLAMVPHERYFRTNLGSRLAKELNAPIASVMLLPGTARNQRTGERVGNVQVLGVDDAFALVAPPKGVVQVNDKLAADLGLNQDDEVLLRVSRPSLLPRDAPLTRTDVADISLALTARVSILSHDADGPARFSLQASQIPPRNAFISLAWLQEQLKLPGQANLMLVGAPGDGDTTGDALTVRANQSLREHWRMEDVNLLLRTVEDQGIHELRTSRVFLDEALVAAALEVARERNLVALGALTYLVNEFDAGGRKTPYSMAVAIGPLHLPADASIDGAFSRPAPASSVQVADLIPSLAKPVADAPAPIVLNEWLAGDLGANVGDTIKLRYYTVGPSRDLVEVESPTMRVQRIVPIEGAAADRSYLPDFPDLPDESTTFSQWKPGFKLTRSIRKVDDEYWAKHRGTPKAFLPLTMGQSLWGNRFGNLTAIRFPAGAISRDELESAIRAKLDPAAIGLSFVPVRQQALTASSSGFDFAQLFLGFSFFLIVAALLLTGLLFVFAIEQRSAEVGTLLAVGFKPAKVRRLLLGEGLVLAMVGAAIGTVCGLAYTLALLTGLTTIWRDAISTSSLQFHVKPMTIPLGFVASVAVAGVTIAWVLRKQARTPARELLAGSVPASAGERAGVKVAATGFISRTGTKPLMIGAFFILAAIAWLASLGTAQAGRNAGAFFGAGSMLLAGGLSLCFGVLARMAATSRSEGPLRLTIARLGLRNAARRRGRSLATIGLLACGSFLVIAIGAFWLDAGADSIDRKSGTGGFALYGESTLPVLVDLNTDAGLDKFALERDDLPGVAFVPMRLRDGDDASCLNLNRAQNPRLAGVDWKKLAEREAFTFAGSISPAEPVADGKSSWSVLGESSADSDVVYALGDQNTVVYGLGKGLGDVLDYTDESGRSLKVKIAALTSNSILQGMLFIDEEQFKKRFPSVSGHRLFLIDAPSAAIVDAKKKLAAAMGDVGMELTPTVERLAAFNAVQNTYLGIFQALGGLGLVLGSIGLGIVVMRNVLERRSELALLAAIGFAAKTQRWLVISEHWFLLTAGLMCGVIAAAIAVLPAVLSPGAKVPYALLAAILGGVVVSGGAWTWLASRLALRGRLLGSLRGE